MWYKHALERSVELISVVGCLNILRFVVLVLEFSVSIVGATSKKRCRGLVLKQTIYLSLA